MCSHSYFLGTCYSWLTTDNVRTAIVSNEYEFRYAELEGADWAQLLIVLYASGYKDVHVQVR